MIPKKRKRDAVDKKVTPIRSQKKKIVNKDPAPETAESECKSSAINVAYIVGIFGAIGIYKWFSTEKDTDCPELQPEVHCRVERVADDPPSPKPDIISLDKEMNNS